ncbi:MAG: threonine synthase [Gammaproteobacteria bacterium]|nr:threonine synthase [Gammaproteobacteria bacterium]
MRYVSTRGDTVPMPFSQAVLTGLAPDGGLLVPERFPDVADKLDAWRELSYVELAQEIFRLYVDDIPAADLDAIVADAFTAFDHPDIVPLVDLGDFKVLELFHGPTLSFKDVALQTLGRVFDYLLGKSGQHLNIVGATSGDTGSAAIYGVRGRENLSIFVLYPNGGTSALQELQMTAVPDANVHCLAIDGSFDDCQSILKSTFGDLAFKARHRLGAVNSINWARVLAQMSYYVHVCLRSEGPAVFAVPTGNFGNIFAAIAVRGMGVPIGRFVLATNDNDILARFFRTGVYRRGAVHQTISPSMDIQVASNLERFLWLRFGRNPERVKRFMAEFATSGEAAVVDGKGVDDSVDAVAVAETDTRTAMRDIHRRYGYVADPHSAVGIEAARRVASKTPDGTKPVCIATAHPAKFPDAVIEAIGSSARDAARHPRLDCLDAASARRAVLPADIEAVKNYIGDHASRQ